MAKNKVNARFSIALLFIVLIFALTGFMLTRPSNALANSESITNSQELLTSLKNLYDHRNDAYSHEYTVDAEISLSDSETYAPYNYNDMTNASSITFYYPVKNVLNSYYEDVSQNLHYGLIKCDYYGGDNLHVYYGVTLIVGEGASINSNNITRYEYTKGATLPTASDLTAPVGKSFVKWIETDDSTETAVTTISISDWGVKSYTAIWSTLDNEQDENEGDAGNTPIPEPTSHAIKYYNLLGVDDTSLPTSYIDGIALDLPILTKVGYTFNGFVIKGSSVKVDSLSEVLNAGIVADDGSIHLSAVWSLNTPTIDSITPINKIYDGIPENITPTYSHGGDEGLTYSFSWLYSIDGTSPYVEVADTESLLVKNVNDSGFYKLRVSVTDAFSHQAQIDSSAISVNIAPIELSLTKGAITPNIAKSYDGTTSCDFNFVYGSHYILKGAVNGEINSVEYTTKFDGVNVSENRKVIVTFGALVMNEAYQLSNYVYTPNASSLTYSAKINVRNITLIANSTPDIFKTYDGTNTCNHEFKLGVDYNIDGAIGNEILGVNYTALYDTADASDNKQILFTANNLVMNDGFTSANYSALTEITFNGKITPKSISITPEALTKTYGATDMLTRTLNVGVNGETVEVTYEREIGETVGVYAYTAVTTANSNYVVNLADNVLNKFTITPAIPSVIFPTFTTRDYDPNLTLQDLTPTENTFEKTSTGYENSLGKFYWVDATLTPTANIHEYGMSFDPNDTYNYDYSKIDGWDETSGLVKRTIYVRVNKINPNYPALPLDGASGAFIVPIGASLNYIALPSGWGYSNESALTKDTIIDLPSGSTANYPNALVFTPEDTTNYNLIYADLNLKAVAPQVYYLYNGEQRSLGNLISVTSNPDDTKAVTTTLKNPFTEVGYHACGWVINNAITITTEDGYEVGSLYTFTDLSLIDFNVFIEVIFAPNTNTKITIKHFYESVSGSFLSNADVIDSTRSGTSDTEYALTDADRKNKLGFIFDYATAEGSNIKINALNVEPDGSTTFCLYYKRKTIEVSYVDANYSSLNPIGSLPANKTVKFGVPFTLDKPTNYLIYGYTFKGYTDGLTYDGNALKIYGVIPYAITDATIDNIIFTIVMTPNTNTEYVVRRYLDGVEEILTYYGATGNHVTIENMNLLGYVRSPKNDEILSGTISGYVKDQSGAITAGSRLELKIYFESKLYDLTFSGTDGTADQQAKVGDKITLPDAPTAPEGHSFSGWLINGVTYSAGAEYVMPASQVTVTAVWSKITAPSTEQNAPEANQSTPSSNEKTSLGGGAIAGIVIGSVAFISIVIAVVFIIIKRNKQSNQ